MTDTIDRELLNAKLGELLHIALVRIRASTDPTWETDRTAEIHDLADLLHNMPRFVVGHDEYAVGDFDSFRGDVIRHVARFYPNIDPVEHRYVALLDMDADSFAATYRRAALAAS